MLAALSPTGCPPRSRGCFSFIIPFGAEETSQQAGAKSSGIHREVCLLPAGITSLPACPPPSRSPEHRGGSETSPAAPSSPRGAQWLPEGCGLPDCQHRALAVQPSSPKADRWFQAEGFALLQLEICGEVLLTSALQQHEAQGGCPLHTGFSPLEGSFLHDPKVSSDKTPRGSGWGQLPLPWICSTQCCQLQLKQLHRLSVLKQPELSAVIHSHERFGSVEGAPFLQALT